MFLRFGKDRVVPNLEKMYSQKSLESVYFRNPQAAWNLGKEQEIYRGDQSLAKVRLLRRKTMQKIMIPCIMTSLFFLASSSFPT